MPARLRLREWIVKSMDCGLRQNDGEGCACRRAIMAGLPRAAGMITGYETGNPSFRRKPESTPTGCRWQSRACRGQVWNKRPRSLVWKRSLFINAAMPSRIPRRPVPTPFYLLTNHLYSFPCLSAIACNAT